MNPSLLGKLILFTLFLQLVGIGVELVLLEHYEDNWQLAPLILIGAGLIAGILYSILKSNLLARLFVALMGLVIVSGFVGTWQHFMANLEFEQEMYPSLSGPALWLEALQGATPALAPGSMIGIGLIGIIYINYNQKQILNQS